MKPQHQTFVKELVKGKSQGEAYAKAYNRPVDDYAYVAGSRLVRNDNIKRTLEEIEKDLPVEAAQAFESYKELAKDPKTPAAIKERIYAKLMALGGMQETNKVEVDDKRVFPGLNDAQSKLELYEKAMSKVREDIERE